MHLCDKTGGHIKDLKIINMKAPKVITFSIAVILAALGALASLGLLAPFSNYAFWLVVAGFVLLALGNLLDGL